MAPKKAAASAKKAAASAKMKAASEKKKVVEKKAAPKKQTSRRKSTASMASKKSQKVSIEDIEDEEMSSATPVEDKIDNQCKTKTTAKEDDEEDDEVSTHARKHANKSKTKTSAKEDDEEDDEEDDVDKKDNGTKRGFLSIPKEEMPSQRRKRRKTLTLEEKRKIGRENRKSSEAEAEAEADIIPAPGNRAQDLLERAQKLASQMVSPKGQVDAGWEDDETNRTPQNARSSGGVGVSPNFNTLTHNLVTKKHFHEALGKLGSFVDDGGAPTPTTASSHGERQVRTPNSITTNKLVSPGSASLCSEKPEEKQQVQSDDKQKRKRPEKVNIAPMKEILKQAMQQFTLDDDEVLEVLNNFKTIFLSEAVLKTSTIGAIVSMIAARTSDQEVKELSKKLLDAWKHITSKSIPHHRARIGTFDLSEVQPKPAVGTEAPAASEVAPICN